VTPVRPRATAITAPRPSTARAVLPIGRALWRASQTPTRPTPRVVVLARPRASSGGGVAPVADVRPHGASCDAAPRRSATQRDLEMASAFLFMFLVLAKLVK